MKRRETKGWQEDAGRSPLARAGARWLRFARGLTRGRGRRLTAADTLAFVESLYGGKFRAVEGGAFPLDKVYRTTGGGLFVSETRVSVRVRPRFDLRLTSVAVLRELSVVREQHLVHGPRQEYIGVTLDTHPPPVASSRIPNARAGGGSPYGGKFAAVGGGAVSLEKVYRAGRGGLFVSETRPGVSVHAPCDPRLFNVAHSHTGQQVFKGGPTTSLTLLTHAGARGRVRQGAASHRTEAVTAAAPPPTVRTWGESPAVAGRVQPAFGYVSARGRRVQPERERESARPAQRVERHTRFEVTARTGVVTPRTPEAPAARELRPAGIDIRQHFIHAPRQEFVNLLFKTYLRAAASSEVRTARATRELLSTRTTRELLNAPAGGAKAQGEAVRRPTSAPSAAGTPGQRGATWTYAEPAPRQAPGVVVELRTESRSTERVRERTATPGPQAPLIHLLPPASLLLSLSETSLTLLAESAGVAGRVTYPLSAGAAAPSLQLVRTHAAPPAAREGSALAHATRRVGQAPRHQTESTRELLSSTHTFAGHTHTTAAVTHGGHTKVYTRPVFETVLRRGPGQAMARRRAVQSGTASAHTATRGLQGRLVESLRHASVESVRTASVTELLRAASAHDAGARATHGFVSNVFSAHVMQGTRVTGALVFTKVLSRRSEAAPGSNAPPAPASATVLRPAATALRTAAAAEGEREAGEPRAARPEGMALELIRHRREQVLQLPQPGYVFTQPAPRPQLEERQVITKASREEIVEVVRREVRSLAASAPAAAPPSRADLAVIADEIYSTLVRRLMVEKERLGRF